MRNIFCDIVLGLEYFYYEGVVYWDIKLVNLLWIKDYCVKIFDFGVLYFGWFVCDGELDDVVFEFEVYDFDDDFEFVKMVGIFVFFVFEFCYIDVYDDKLGVL